MKSIAGSYPIGAFAANGDMLVARWKPLHPYYQSKGFVLDDYAQGRAADSGMRTAFRDLLRSIDQLGTELTRVQDTHRAAEMVALKARGDMIGFQLLDTVVHQALRRDLRRLAESLRRPVRGARQAALADQVDFVLVQLHHYYRIEQELIWPTVVGRRPELAGLSRAFREAHGRLGWVVDRLTNANRAWTNAAGQAAVHGAVIDLDTVLEPQLQHQEAEAMPAICAALSI